MSRMALINYLMLFVLAISWYSTSWGTTWKIPLGITVFVGFAVVMNLHVWNENKCGAEFWGLRGGYREKHKCTLVSGHKGGCVGYWGDRSEDSQLKDQEEEIIRLTYELEEFATLIEKQYCEENPTA